jgi:hypothetical protein
MEGAAMLNTTSLRAQAGDAVIRAEIAASYLRATRERLAVRTARLDRSRALAQARAARDAQRATMSRSRNPDERGS